MCVLSVWTLNLSVSSASLWAVLQDLDWFNHLSVYQLHSLNNRHRWLNIQTQSQQVEPSRRSAFSSALMMLTATSCWETGSLSCQDKSWGRPAATGHCSTATPRHTHTHTHTHTPQQELTHTSFHDTKTHTDHWPRVCVCKRTRQPLSISGKTRFHSDRKTSALRCVMFPRSFKLGNFIKPNAETSLIIIIIIIIQQVLSVCSCSHCYITPTAASVHVTHMFGGTRPQWLWRSDGGCGFVFLRKFHQSQFSALSTRTRVFMWSALM